MYPVSVVGTAASSDVPDDEDNCVSSEGKDEEVVAQSAILGGGLQQAEAAALTSAIVVGKGVSTNSKGKAPAKRRGTAVVSTASTVVRVSARSNKGKAPAKRRGTAVVSTASTVVRVSARSNKGKAPVKGRGIVSVLTTSTAVGVSAKSKGKAPAKKRGIAAAVSGCTVDPDVLSALGVVLSPDGVQIIAGLFSRVNEFAKRFYNSMVSKQLPSSLSDKLSLIERAIWYSTYRKMCEDVFVLMCLGEYHTKHRPGFILALPRIEVLSDSLERVSVPLIGDSLLGFLSRLDRAVRSNVESIFDSFWSEVSASLEGEALNDVSCGDFINVLDTAGIPEVAPSVIVTQRKEIRDTIKRTTSGIITASDHILSSWSHRKDGNSSYGLSSDPILAERHTGSNNIPVSACDEINIIRAPVWMPPVFDEEDILPSSVEPSKVNLLPSVGHSGARSSFDPSAAKRHIGSDSVSVGMPPVLDDDLPSSTVSIPSYLQCTDSLGVNLHPDSAILVHGLFYSIRIFCTSSFSRSVSRYISNMLVSELSAVERVICFKTYRELHLSAFISRCLCMYHSRYRPTFIRALANIRVLSGSSDHGLTSLNGVNLVDFLSKLDCAIRDLVWSVFNSRWAVETGKACSELACGLLNDVSCKDLIRVLGVADVPVASFSVFRKYMMNKSKTSVSSSKITAVGTDSGSDITDHEPLEEDYGSSSDESSSNIIDDALVSTGDSACSEFVALVGGSTTATSHSPSISLPTPASSYPSTSGPHSQSKTQLGSLLLLEESSDQSPRFVALFSYRDQSGSVSTAGTDPTFVGSPEGTGSSLPFVTRSVSESNVSSESLLTVSDAVLVPTADDTVPNLEVSGDELSASSSLPSFEWEQVPIFPPFLQHHWLEKLD